MKIINFFLQKNKNTPSWLIFLIDIFIVLISILSSYLLRFNFSVPENEIKILFIALPYIIFVRGLSFFIGTTYNGIIRYTSTEDAKRIFFVIFFGSLFFLISNFLRFHFFDKKYFIPTSIIGIDFFILVFMLIFLRIFVKILYFEFFFPKKIKKNVIIVGSDESAIITKRTIDRDTETNYKVIAFLETEKKNINKKLEGTKIFYYKKIDEILNKNKIRNIIFAKKNIRQEEKKIILEKCLDFNVNILNVPDVSNWINGKLTFKQIRKIKIEDLLQREAINLEKDKIKSIINDKIILITGAAGSIGSEICLQVLKFSPKKVILLDNAETPSYNLELELIENLKIKNFKFVIADIRDKRRLKNIFKIYSPEIVFHAAAYKHVPMMEINPSEAIYTNVYGTKNLADLSVEFNVKKFLMISTDKAVNPSSIMGTSKRIAEIYIQSFNSISKTQFITTRFGNVLGSNGSVIPRFKKQIEERKAITVTHPEITRYFMTIPEACQLVLQANALGKGGEIFIFDMGKSIKILDLAKKMIKLSGLEIEKDIKIKFTGMRPGEKLYEELLNKEENNLKTPHSQIMIAKVRNIKFEKIKSEIKELLEIQKTHNVIEIVKKMKKIVPEFKNKKIF